VHRRTAGLRASANLEFPSMIPILVRETPSLLRRSRVRSNLQLPLVPPEVTARGEAVPDPPGPGDAHVAPY
jgi:hypothetical protein